MDEKEFKEKYEPFRRKAYVTIYGTNARLSRLFDLVLLALIFVSVVMVMLEAVGGIDHRLHGLLVFMRWVITIFFTVEYILRIISNRKPYRYIFSIYDVIDLIAISPMYLSFTTPSTEAILVVRALRLLRIFRILDLVSSMSQGEELKLALHTNKNKILVFTYFVFVISILLGSLMYAVENEHSRFTSIPRSVYQCTIALTVVDCGDISPTTILGQMVASSVMILGYGIVAVPTGIVTAEYNRVSRTNILKERQRCQQKELLTGKHTEKAICHRCSNLGHLEGVNYCSSCRVPLKRQIDKCPEKSDYF